MANVAIKKVCAFWSVRHRCKAEKADEPAGLGCGLSVSLRPALPRQGGKNPKWTSLISRERAREIYEAAELGRNIRFDNGMEARLYRECYIKTHVGVIDVECQDAVKQLGAG